MADRSAPSLAAASAAAGAARGSRRELMIVGAVLVAFSASIGVLALQLAARRAFRADSSGAFPLIVAAGLLLFSVLFLLQAIRPRDDGFLEQHMAGEKETTRVRVVVWIVVILIGYAALVDVLGYTLATTAQFVIVVRLLGSKRWVWNITVAVAMSVLIYLGFTELLGVQLPTGFLGVI